MVSNKELIKDTLLIQEDKLQKKVDRVKEHIGILESGEVVIKTSTNQLLDKNIAALQLIGAYYADLAELRKTPTVPIKEIEGRTRLDNAKPALNTLASNNQITWNANKTRAKINEDLITVTLNQIEKRVKNK